MPVDPPVKGLESYRAFFNELYQTAEGPGGPPWTRLGFTYDRNPQTPIYGASKYIVTPDAPSTVASATSIAAYCNP